MIGGSLNISLSLGCNSIRCHFSIRMCFRLDTDGLYCITKGNISLRTLVFSWRAFGECPLYFSALQNSQYDFKVVRSSSVLSKIHSMILRVLFSQSQFDHLRYNSLTLVLSQKTARKSTRSYSFIAHSLATQEFPVIVDFIYWFS